jgi:hypothetical protein
LLAALLVAAEAVLLVAQGLGELALLSADRLAMGVTTAVFFLLYGLGLLFCARGLARRRSWARAPILVAQLIQLLVAWSFFGGSTTVVAVVLGVVAVVAMLAVLHPASIAALADDHS